MRIEKLHQTYDIDVNLIHFPLHPDTPADGMTLEQLFAGRGGDAASRKARQERMKGLMRDEGLPYGERTHTYNSRLAQELGKWADTQADSAAIHDAIYRAYFVDGKNIGDVDVLVELAASVGLDATAARRVLETRSFKEAIDADWQLAGRSGVTGVPTFAAGGYGVVGAQPYETIAELLENAGAVKRAA